MLRFEQILDIKDDELRLLLLTFYGTNPNGIKDDQYSKDMLVRLSILLKDRIMNKGLQEAISNHNDHKFLKKIEISNNLILTRASDDYFNIYQSITGDSLAFLSTNRYNDLITFIRSNGIDFPQDIEKSIADFISLDENNPYYNRKKSKYLSCADERKRFRDILHTEKILTLPTDELTKIKNKTLGNIGEYFTQDFLKMIYDYPRHIAKEIGDGTGFDHHYMLEEYELLVESKATLKDDAIDDYFTLTSNEYKVMLDTLNQNLSRYNVARVFVDPNTVFYKKIHMLRAQDDKTFKLLNNEENCNYLLTAEDDKGGKVFTKKIK